MRHHLSIFPTNVFVEDSFELPDEERKKIYNHHSDLRKVSGHVGNIWATEKRLLAPYPKIENLIIDQFKKVIREELDYHQDFQLATSWIMKVPPGGLTHVHAHKNSYYAGVYYYDEYVGDSGLLRLESPWTPFSDFYLIPREWSLKTDTSIEIPARKNHLVFFPAYIPHMVDVNNSNKDRYSLVFNIVPLGEYGGRDSSYSTDWIRK